MHIPNASVQPAPPPIKPTRANRDKLAALEGRTVMITDRHNTRRQARVLRAGFSNEIPTVLLGLLDIEHERIINGVIVRGKTMRLKGSRAIHPLLNS
jgi:hypothetical protein